MYVCIYVHLSVRTSMSVCECLLLEMLHMDMYVGEFAYTSLCAASSSS